MQEELRIWGAGYVLVIVKKVAGEYTYEEADVILIKATIISGVMLCCAGCAVVSVGTPTQAGGKVAVCHKGKKTIYVDESAVDAHLAHGDYPGMCR